MFRQPFSGRPLVGKKNPIMLHAKLDSAEEDVYDEGYGTSPVITSPQTDGIFVFTEPERSKHVAHSPLEDDWYSLAKEINEVVGQQPSICDGVKRQIGKLNFEVPKQMVPNMPVRRVPPPPPKESPSKQSRNCCVFCQKNGEIRSVVESHILRHPVTRVVICPVLRKYKCDLCGASGDNAHTKFYCPENRNRMIAPMATLLKTTRNNATGKRNYH